MRGVAGTAPSKGARTGFGEDAALLLSDKEQ